MVLESDLINNREKRRKSSAQKAGLFFFYAQTYVEGICHNLGKFKETLRILPLKSKEDRL